MKATPTSWKIQPFVSGVPLPIEIEVAASEFGAIEDGLIPEDMNQKWFMYYESPCLYIHRSWTGLPYYRVEFGKNENNVYLAREALLTMEAAKDFADADGLKYQGQLLTYLIGVLLLNRNLPLPKPPKRD